MSLIYRRVVVLVMALLVMAGCTPATQPPQAAASTPVVTTVAKPNTTPVHVPLPLPTGGLSTKGSIIKGCQKTADDTDKVTISIDDGISSQKKLDTMLKLFKKENVRAYFFLTGEFAKNHPKMMTQIAAAGHVLGNHSYKHPNFNLLSDTQIKSEIKHGVKGNTKAKLLRPPFGNGAFDKHMQKLAKSLGYGMCYWTVDTRDWSNASTKSVKDILKRVKKGDQWTPSITKGGVILLHGTTKYGAAALPGIIKIVRAKGLTLQQLHS